MGSYIVRIDDIKEVARQMELLARKKGGVLNYKNGVFEQLVSEEFQRIKWFYYCDNDNGNTIRLYDTQFFDKFSHCYYADANYRVILRGKNLGGENEDTKDQMINLFSVSFPPPRQINTEKENLDACNKYFEGPDMNNDAGQKGETRDCSNLRPVSK